jgi:probable HAF family extracellular repeat protein
MLRAKVWLRCACLSATLVVGFVARADAYEYRTFDYPGAGFTAGFTITPTGEIGGYTCIDGLCQGFFQEAREEAVLVPAPEATDSFITGIARGGGLLSGQYTDAAGTAHGYLWIRNGQDTFLTVDPEGSVHTEVADMNPAGDLAGNYQDAGGVSHGFVQMRGVITPFDVPGAVSTAAYGINPQGDLVGTFFDGQAYHAYLLAGGVGGVLTVFHIPGAVAANAFGINAVGQVVGGYTLADGTTHGYVRNPDGEVVTVEPPGAVFSVAFAINPAGQITGLYCDEALACHAFIAAPVHGQMSDQSAGAPQRFVSAPKLSASKRIGKGGLARSISRN